MPKQSTTIIPAVGEYIKYQKIQPIDHAKDLMPTQTKTASKFIRTGKKDTASGLDESSIIDVIIEERGGLGQCVGVYIYPSNEKISDLLEKIKVKDRVSVKKQMEYVEVKDKFVKMFPKYTDSFVFREVISRYGYETKLHSDIVRGANALS